MVSLSVLIFSMLLYVDFDPDILNKNTSLKSLITVLWIIFVVISLMYSFNGILMFNCFKREVYRYQKAGKPLKGVRGYTELMDGLSLAKTTSIIISFASLVSLIIFQLSLNTSSNFDERTIASVAVTMALVTVSAVFIVNYPEGTALEAGALVSFYEPDAFPLTLDNLLSDVFLTYVDPITYMAVDEWTEALTDILKLKFEENEDKNTRIERAREKIFLLAYLANSIPETITEEVIMNEISEVVRIDKLDRFVNGVNTGLSWSEIKAIMAKIEKESPEVFRLVDRLLINLMDNYNSFTSEDIYFTVSTLTNQGSIHESSGIIAFFLNNTDNPNRKMNVEFRSDIDSIHPHYQKISITLDPLTFEYPATRPEFIAEGADILSLLSSLLQVGDGVWFRFKPKGFGFKVVTIQAEEEGTSNVMGTSIEMKFTKSIGWYVKTFAPKLTALSGVALPFVRKILF